MNDNDAYLKSKEYVDRVEDIIRDAERDGFEVIIDEDGDIMFRYDDCYHNWVDMDRG